MQSKSMLNAISYLPWQSRAYQYDWILKQCQALTFVTRDFWNMACMVNAVHLKEKTSKDVDKDPNEKRDEYDTHLETET